MEYMSINALQSFNAISIIKKQNADLGFILYQCMVPSLYNNVPRVW
jgi:hypothetical protein